MDFKEYPKHVVVGQDKDGAAITKIVETRSEEIALLESLKAAEPVVPAAGPVVPAQNGLQVVPAISEPPAQS